MPEAANTKPRTAKLQFPLRGILALVTFCVVVIGVAVAKDGNITVTADSDDDKSGDVTVSGGGSGSAVAKIGNGLQLYGRSQGSCRRLQGEARTEADGGVDGAG